MKKMIGALLAAAGTLALMTASASAFVGEARIASTDGSGLCIADQANSGAAGTPIVMNSCSSTAPSQKLNIFHVDACNGTSNVTATCPFTTDMALNTQYEGDTITYLETSSSEQGCIHWVTGHGLEQGTYNGCDSINQYWEFVQNGSSHQIISVGASNAYGAAAFMCDTGRGNQVTANPTCASNNTKWEYDAE